MKYERSSSIKYERSFSMKYERSFSMKYYSADLQQVNQNSNILTV